MTYQITYETADGTIESFSEDTSKARAMKSARDLAKGSALNAPLNVSRWLVEKCDQTIAYFMVSA